MKISILCNDGSPIGVSSKTIWGDDFRIGVGGAELAMLTMAEEWTKAGHEVILYNDPWELDASPFEQRNVVAFSPAEDRDILINFRSPNPQSISAKGLKVWWSTDQYSMGNYAEFAGYMNKIVCISPFHAEYFANTYNIQKSIVIDLPVRIDDFKENVEKIHHRFIFSSVPDRGLHNLWRMWHYIKTKIPDASLVITSDYRLWGSGSNNERYRVMWMEQNDFEFLGAVNRARYIEELQKAEIFFYPCEYPELFCISCAEAQFAGLLTVTTSIGALSTTNMGCALQLEAGNIRNDAALTDILASEVNSPDFAMRTKDISEKARERFSPQNILKQWDEKVFK